MGMRIEDNGEREGEGDVKNVQRIGGVHEAIAQRK